MYQAVFSYKKKIMTCFHGQSVLVFGKDSTNLWQKLYMDVCDYAFMTIYESGIDMGFFSKNRGKSFDEQLLSISYSWW